MTNQSILTCCANHHKFNTRLVIKRVRPEMRDAWIEGSVRGTILYCDTQRHRPNIVAAGDRLRDFLTAHIISAQLDNEGNNCCVACGASLVPTYGFPYHAPEADCPAQLENEGNN